MGAAKFIRDTHSREVNQLGIDGGVIDVWAEGELTWVRCNLQSTPPWLFERLPNVESLEALDGPQDPAQAHTMLWAWIDRDRGIARARTFAAAWGIPEDEANGSGCLRLAAALGQSIEFHHGRGSIVHARPSHPGYGEVGGLAVRGEDIFLPFEEDSLNLP